MREGNRHTGLAALIVAVLTVVIWSGPAAADQPQFEWLCKPGKVKDPCQGSQLTTRVPAAGTTSQSTPRQLPRLKAKVDCFYVYPTVSGQAGPNANLAEDPEISGIARQQATRFTTGCRMYAPIYRQYTVPALLNGHGIISEQGMATAYDSVKAAWDEYLTKYNKGRGIVLIGHSQGTGHLKRLIAETFDQQPKLRHRLVSAVLIGGNVIVAKDRLDGGSFQNVPGCSKAGQLGCVIAFSSFLKDPPPEDSLFGRVGGALTESGLSPETHEVLCVNPAELDGSQGKLHPLYETKKFPGIYGPLLPDLTAISTPWASFPDLYTGECKQADGASWLAVTDISGEADTRPRIGESLGRNWGTHLTEVNDTAGNLLSVVTSQEATFVNRQNQPLKKRLKRQIAEASKTMAGLRKRSQKLRKKARKASGKKRRGLTTRAKQAGREATKQRKRIKTLRRKMAALDPLGR